MVHPVCVLPVGCSAFFTARLNTTKRKSTVYGSKTKARVSRGRCNMVYALRNIDWPEALLFDCDGVLVDTERDGHRVAFNEAFARKGLQHQWDVDLYGRLLEIGGGKERMTKYFQDCIAQEPFKSMSEAADRKAFVAELHKLKTDIFMEFVESGAMPLRPGVQRLVCEALENNVKVAVCSTSNERAVSTIVRVLLGEDIARRMPVFAGDIVPKKKPAPDIYLLAAKELHVQPARCVVVEDSKIGLLAARAAGMRCVVTTSSYTADEDFALADAVFDCIGDKGQERFSINDLTTPGVRGICTPLIMDMSQSTPQTGNLLAGTFWLNPPVPTAEDGTWYGKTAEELQLVVDIDPPFAR